MAHRAVALGVIAALGASPLAAAQTRATTTAPAPRSCAQHLPLGEIAYASGVLDQAYVNFSSCRALEPRNVRALIGLGRTETRLRLFTGAITHLNEAISVDSRNVSAYIALAQAYTEQFVTAKDRASLRAQLDAALRVLQDAEGIATRNEDKAKVFNERGRVYKYRDDLPRALDAYKQAAALLPTDSIVLFNLGAAQLETPGQVDAAIETLRRAVDASPRDAITRAYLAKALRAKGDPASMRAALSEATQAYNTSAAARKDAFVVGQYGILLYMSGNKTVAKTALETATKLDVATYHENLFFLGRVYLDANQGKEARTALSKAAVLEPTEPSYYYYLGRANEAIGDKAAARQSYERAIKLNPNYKEPQTALAALK